MADPLPSVRRARPADAPAFARLMSHADVYGNLLQLPLPSEDYWRSRIESFGNPDRNEISLVAELDGEVVGSAGLHPAPQVRRRHTASLGISVAHTAQRRGVGSALMRALCDYADNWGQIWRIELFAFADNAPAIALYTRFGFRHEGTHRAYALRHGRYDDVCAMARLHPAQPLVQWPAS